MCIKQLLDSENVSHMTGNPTAQESWLRARLLSVLGDYAMLVTEACDLAGPVTFTIDKGDDAGEYIIRNGLKKPLQKKLERLRILALDVAVDIVALPKSGDAHLVSQQSQGKRSLS